MKVLVTGGAGFIGRWVVKKLLEDHTVVALDNFSNSDCSNITDFQKMAEFTFIQGDILNHSLLTIAFKGVDLCIHLAAQINVQESLDYPARSFTNNVVGTFRVLEECRKNDAKLVLVGTCLVYDVAVSKAISEEHPIKPASPYAASKVAAENLAISYYHGYSLPAVILRPFNTYGPYQKSGAEGGVVSVFLKNLLGGKDIVIYGDGEQTRDLLYVEDCANFIIKAAFCEKAIGEIINAGTGVDTSINDLAFMICNDKKRIKHVPHVHPQSEIRKLKCDYSKAKKVVGWEPSTALEGGIRTTRQWITHCASSTHHD
jgi:UDP-glucose 4-epimerase